MKQLTLAGLQKAVASAAAFRSRQRLQPAGGEGDKVFPPTYEGAVYATEKRRVPGREEPVDCVLLDSVQSQANRMEEALQQAVDEERLKLPVIEVDFERFFDEARARLPENERGDKDLLDPVGKVTSLQAPHRIADAILRDSLLDGKPFRESDIGRKIDRAEARNATPLFDLCPTALLFGMWDSTGPKGGLGAKFERAMVSEIVGIDAVYGVKTSSRIDPLGIQRKAGPIYSASNQLGWTLDESEARRSKGKPVMLGKEGKPSEVNHGNVTPSLSKEDRDGNYLAGGVTIDHAEQTTVISLPALRRLRFPVDGHSNRERDVAGRAVIAALGLVAASLADETGLDLRSRCLLYPEAELTWELLDRGGGSFTLPSEQAIEVFNQAVEAARAAGLPWREEPLALQPSEQLVKLVVKSQNLAAQQGVDEERGD